ncbi:hypothetical protein BC936DRAFT_138563 [Jimgerdemannia flammicorona]|uniref:polynucleotide adenylyltransferase n=1 Tax=Jimgerdemannia flammicorona TaxID=994334 RepID=A0A433C3U1_9FUNG|nr:hypothetical protein BC936DRAFT_138563 [Jimgerdemannia flammicorona]
MDDHLSTNLAPPGVQHFTPHYSAYLTPPPTATNLTPPPTAKTSMVTDSSIATHPPPLPNITPRPPPPAPTNTIMLGSLVGNPDTLRVALTPKHGAPKHGAPKLERKQYSEEVLQILTDEIVNYEAYILPTAKEWAVRQWIIDRVTEAVRSLWPMASVRPFGSFKTGLSLPTSDIDVTAFLPQGQIFNPKTDLRRLATKLTNIQICSWKDVQCNHWAKVPIVHFTESVTEIECDISVNTESVSTDRVCDYLARHANLKPLFLVAKRALSTNPLVMSPATGGLASFSLVCMLVSFLQLEAPKFPDAKLGELLLCFFAFYGYEFNWANTGIIMTNGGCYFDKTTLPMGSKLDNPRFLTIQDPDDSMVNVSRATNKTSLVCDAFCGVSRRLENRIISLSNRSVYSDVDGGRLPSVLDAIAAITPRELEMRSKAESAYEDYAALYFRNHPLPQRELAPCSGEELLRDVLVTEPIGTPYKEFIGTSFKEPLVAAAPFKESPVAPFRQPVGTGYGYSNAGPVSAITSSSAHSASSPYSRGSQDRRRREDKGDDRKYRSREGDRSSRYGGNGSSSRYGEGGSNQYGEGGSSRYGESNSSRYNESSRNGGSSSHGDDNERRRRRDEEDRRRERYHTNRRENGRSGRSSGDRR